MTVDSGMNPLRFGSYPADTQIQMNLENDLNSRSFLVDALNTLAKVEC